MLVDKTFEKEETKAPLLPVPVATGTCITRRVSSRLNLDKAKQDIPPSRNASRQEADGNGATLGQSSTSTDLSLCVLL